MNPTDDVPDLAQRGLLALIALYFAVTVYALVANDITANIAADVLFGVISLAIGAVLYRQSNRELSPTLAASACFVAGAIAQFGAVITGETLLDLLTTAAVIAGIVLYVVAIRRASP